MSEKSEGYMLPTRPDPIHARSTHAPLDPEKHAYSGHTPAMTPGFTPANSTVQSPSQPSTITSEWNCEYVPEEKPPHENHLGLILLYLSTINPLVAGVLSMYSVFTTLLLALLTPLSFCISRQPLSNSIISSLSPVLRIQLRTIYCSSASSDGESTGHVLCAAILAPFFAVAIAFASWVAGSFWGFAAILGEPNNGAGEEQDGRDAIRAVRRMWESWLLWGLQ